MWKHVGGREERIHGTHTYEAFSHPNWLIIVLLWSTSFHCFAFITTNSMVLVKVTIPHWSPKLLLHFTAYSVWMTQSTDGCIYHLASWRSFLFIDQSTCSCGLMYMWLLCFDFSLFSTIRSNMFIHDKHMVLHQLEELLQWKLPWAAFWVFSSNLYVDPTVFIPMHVS